MTIDLTLLEKLMQSKADEYLTLLIDEINKPSGPKFRVHLEGYTIKHIPIITKQRRILLSMKCEINALLDKYLKLSAQQINEIL